ncbi:NHL repeat-containing protein [Bdellovibrio bacteriovorus]
MDRALTYLLSLFLLFALTGCWGGSSNNGNLLNPGNNQKPGEDKAGPFPLGDPGFTAQYKTFLRSSSVDRFVFASNGNEIHIVNAKGTRIRSFIPEKVQNISGLWVDEGGAIYVTGQENDPPTKQFLRKYDFSGTFLGELVTFTGPNWPMPMNPMVGGDGFIYLYEAANTKIRKYDVSGNPVLSIGEKGSDVISGHASYTVDREGNIYVADMKTDRLQKFDSKGNLVSKFDWPRQIKGSAVSDMIMTDTSFIVAERMGSKGQVTSFTHTGTLNWTRDGSEHRSPYLGNLMSLTMNKGKLYLGIQDSLVVYKPDDGSFITKFVKRMNSPKTLVRGPLGQFYVGSNNGIHLFNNQGAYVKTFGPTSSPIMGLAIDSRKILYAIDLSEANTVLRFDLNGNPLDSLRVKNLSSPYALSIDRDDALFIADADGGVVKVNTAAKSATEFGSSTSFTSPAAITVAKDGSVIVMDLENGLSVGKKFSSSGQLLSVFGKNQLSTALGVATSRSGKIYVPDATNHKVMIYDKDGAFVGSFGSKGEGLDKLNQPLGIYIDLEDNIFVADGANHVVKKFKEGGTPMQW